MCSTASASSARTAPAASRRHLGAQRLAVERMGKPDLRTHTVGAHLEQSAEFQPIESGRAREALEHGQADRFTLGHELQCMALVILEGPDALFDELAEPCRHGEPPAGAPKTALESDRAVFLCRQEQLSDGQRVSPGEAAHGRRELGIHGATEDRRDECVDVPLAKRGEVDAIGVPVLPELDDRFGGDLTGPHGRDHKGVASHRQLEDERRRHLIEQMSVIDHDHERSAGRERLELTSGGVERIDAFPQLGQDSAQRTERDGCRRACRREPSGGRAALPSASGERLARQAGLAEAGLPSDHDPAGSVSSQGGDVPELTLSAHEVPARRHRLDSNTPTDAPRRKASWGAHDPVFSRRLRTPAPRTLWRAAGLRRVSSGAGGGMSDSYGCGGRWLVAVTVLIAHRSRAPSHGPGLAPSHNVQQSPARGDVDNRGRDRESQTEPGRLRAVRRLLVGGVIGAGVVVAASQSASAATTARFSNGTLSVFGDNLANTIEISRNAAGTMLVNGGAVAVSGGTPTVANTTLIQVFGLGGNDRITLNQTNGALPRANLFGGAGNDVVTGGAGGDMLFGQAATTRCAGKAASTSCSAARRTTASPAATPTTRCSARAATTG